MSDRYLKHYADLKSIGIFMAVAFVGLIIILMIIYLYAEKHGNRLEAARHGGHLPKRRKKKGKVLSVETCKLIESFYELVFSSTSILFFLAAYYMIDRYLDIKAYRIFWDKYSDILLMAFIFASVFLNAFLDHVLVSIERIDSSQKASIRLVSTIYMVLIFLYIRFIYDDTNYNELIIYFLGLVIGRFLYFDFTWKDFKTTMAGVWKNMPLLVLILIYSGLMCFIGFKGGFLLTSNGVIVSILIAHIFMDISILMMHQVLKHMAEDNIEKRSHRKKEARGYRAESDDAEDPMKDITDELTEELLDNQGESGDMEDENL